MIKFGPWLLAGTPVEEPYPCRCHERRGGRCHPMWCPCSGRIDYDNLPPTCCAHENTPPVWKQAEREYQAKRRAQGG